MAPTTKPEALGAELENTEANWLYRLRWRVSCAGEYLHAACRSKAWRKDHNFYNMTWAFGRAWRPGRFASVLCALESLRTERW